MARDYNIFKNLPEDGHYGQYYSTEGLTADEWHEITGLASIEDVTFGLVNFGMFTGNDLHAYQEWLFDSRRLPMGMCGYFQDYVGYDASDGYSDCYFYGLGGYCLGETMEDCGMATVEIEQSSAMENNLLWKINNKLGASYYGDSEVDSNYSGASCLRGKNCSGGDYYSSQNFFSETCVPDASQLAVDAPDSPAGGWPEGLAVLCDDDWRIIPSAYVNNSSGQEVSVMRYWPYTSNEYLLSSAPNIVNLSIDLARNNGSFDIDYFPGNTWTGEDYLECTPDACSDTFLYSLYDLETGSENCNLSTGSSCMGLGWDSDYPSAYTGTVHWMVTTWDYKLDKIDIDNGFIMPANETELYYQMTVNNAFEVVGAGVWNTDTKQVLSHQYDTAGIKEIRMLAFSLHEDGQVNLLKRIKLRIFLGLDNVYIEDFSDLGGPDFVFIPWPHSNIPVVGGIAKADENGIPHYNTQNSDYIKSLLKVMKSNYFEGADDFNRAFTQQSLINDELGTWPGKMDIHQVRVFTDGNFDLAELLMVGDEYEQYTMSNGKFSYHPYYDFSYWDGYINYFPKETCVGQLFINDNVDLDKKRNCIIEINPGESEVTYIRDSSGNANKGILLGDYKVNKNSSGSPMVRASFIDLPTIETDEGGAF